MTIGERLKKYIFGEPGEDLEDTNERLKVTRELVRELTKNDAATIALLELDELTERNRNEPR